MSDFVPEVEENEGEEDTPMVASNSKPESTNPNIQAEPEQDFSRRFINDKWYGKYGDDGNLLEHVGDDWVPVDPEMEELLSQLWFEQEEQEKNSNAHYDWDPEKNEWVPKAKKEGEEEVNEDFIAEYQANYGVQYEEIYKKMDEEIQQKTAQAVEEEEKKKERKRKKKLGLKGDKGKEEGWVDRSGKVFAVYVSNLPLNITEEEFTEFMSKCGVIQPDFRTNKPKCKLYRDDDGELKGDGR
uniref:RRM domain-containing protein n=1 Tax=Caenorhabditis japonica TaxID=281687 RepID=A0A8R1IRD9_CAEJA